MSTIEARHYEAALDKATRESQVFRRIYGKDVSAEFRQGWIAAIRFARELAAQEEEKSK